jgi:hypothetical protein
MNASERLSPSSTPPKVVSVKKLLSDIPPIDRIEAICTTAPLTGTPIRVTWDGNWEADVAASHRLEDVPRELKATSDLGVVTLLKVMATSTGFGLRNGPAGSTGGYHLSGVATEVILHRWPSPSPALFRCYVSCDGSVEKVCYPQWLEDSVDGHSWCGLLPLVIDGEPMNIFTLKEGPFLVFEARRASLSAFERHVGVARMMLTYLTGCALEGKSCVVVLSPDDDGVTEVSWNGGWGSPQSTIYSPIPITWSAAGRYRLSRGLPIGGKVLDSSMISKCIQALLDEPELETPVAYIRLALESPVEVRGALLSVALESFTSYLERKGRVRFVSPIEPASWDALKSDLALAVRTRAETWPRETRDAAASTFSARIERLNGPTNQAKLTAPFVALGIPVTDAQAKAIESRNRLLHTGRLVSPAKLAADRDAWRGAYVTEMHLLTALNKLILKYLGYRGPVYDWGEAGFDRVAESCFTEI